jgi:uncharacterized protein (DUF433 family)
VNTLQQFEQFIAGLKPAEKACILQWVAQDLGDSYPGIESHPNVCGGEPCIVRTRIPVRVLVQARNLGLSEAAILESYPVLRAEDLVNAWAYYRSHHKDIDLQILDNEAA